MIYLLLLEYFINVGLMSTRQLHHFVLRSVFLFAQMIPLALLRNRADENNAYSNATIGLLSWVLIETIFHQQTKEKKQLQQD